ncbi:MAG TPA: ATP-binding protein [Acidimicrobiales bacterium]
MTHLGMVAVATGSAAGVAVAAAVLAAIVSGLVTCRVVRRRQTADLVDASRRLGIDATPSAADDPASVVAALERAARLARAEADDVSQARSRVQQALDSLPQAVLITDATGTVVERNTAAEAFVSARHSDALVEAAVAELIDRALRGEPASRTVDLFGPPRRVVVVTTTPLESDAGRAAVAVVEDVTERRQLEAIRTDFVANISHELKTPVGAIGLLAETLESEDDPVVSARLAGRIQFESLRVGRTIEDLLELSRIELGQVSVLETVVLDEIVREAMQRIGPAAEQAGITLVGDAVQSGVVVSADRRQLTSALSNLLDNAVKYSDAGGTVDVEVSERGDEVVLSVADHGIGIPTRDIERVFERFYRVDQARSRQTGGTGLGLAIVRHVVANHHGTVEVESRLGEGSRFTLRFPAGPGRGAHSVSAPAASVLDVRVPDPIPERLSP